MLFILSLILIALGLAGTILMETAALQIVSAMVCVIGVILLIVYYQHMYNIQRTMNKTLKEQSKHLENEYNTMKSQKDANIEQLHQKLEKLQSSIPAMPSELPIEQRLEILRSFFLEDEKNNEIVASWEKITLDDLAAFAKKVRPDAVYLLTPKGGDQNG